MSDRYEERMRALEGTLQKEFGLSNPSFWQEALKEKHASKQETVFGLVKAAQADSQRIEERRIEMEEKAAATIIDQRSQHSPGPVAGFISSAIAYPRPVAEEARRNVNAHIEREKFKCAENLRQAINQELGIGEEHAQLFISPERIQEQRELMIRDAQNALNDSASAKQQLHKLFNDRTTQQKLENLAQENGAENPKQAVTGAWKFANNLIDAHTQRRLHATFQEYGVACEQGNEIPQAERIVREASHTETNETVQKQTTENTQNRSDQQGHSQ